MAGIAKRAAAVSMTMRGNTCSTEGSEILDVPKSLMATTRAEDWMQLAGNIHSHVVTIWVLAPQADMPATCMVIHTLSEMAYLVKWDFYRHVGFDTS